MQIFRTNHLPVLFQVAFHIHEHIPACNVFPEECPAPINSYLTVIISSYRTSLKLNRLWQHDIACTRHIPSNIDGFSLMHVYLNYIGSEQKSNVGCQDIRTSTCTFAISTTIEPMTCIRDMGGLSWPVSMCAVKLDVFSAHKLPLFPSNNPDVFLSWQGWYWSGHERSAILSLLDFWTRMKP